MCKEEVPPEQHVGNSSLVQEIPEPLQIKEEQEEHLQIPEEVLTSLAVKSEGDGENTEIGPVASTSTEHMQTGAEERGTSQPAGDDKLLSSHGSESDTDDSDEWEEKREDLSASVKSNKTSRNLKSSKQTHPTSSRMGKKSFSCTVCGKHYSSKAHLKRHTMIHTGEKPYTCNVWQRLG